MATPARGSPPASGSGPLAFSDPTSQAAEAYRVLRVNLQFSKLDGGLRSILVASATWGDGRTAVAANLAVALAESGKRVALVDADLRNPGLHRFFGVQQSPGLTDALLAPEELASLQMVETPGLNLLTSGRTPPNPAEFISSERLAQRIESLVTDYDFVVLDSPPLDRFSDAAILARLVDGVLFVVKSGRTKRDRAVRAREQLDRVGARVLGAVITNSKAS